MKIKLIIIGAVVLLGAGGWFCYRYLRADDKPVAPTPTAKVERSSIRQVVASTGKVVSNLDVDIKCKASGEIVTLPFEISDMVKKDQLLMELDPIDETRLVKQSQVALDSSQAKLKIAQLNLEVAERTLATDNDRAQAAANAADARARDGRAKAARVKDLLGKKLASQEDFDTAETTAIAAECDAQAAQVRIKELETSKKALDLTREQVKLAEAQVTSDAVALEIATQRLKDTKVVAPMDGVVTARNVQIGQIISSGISNVGGGTTALTLSDLTRIFVVASVDESDIGKVSLGQNVSVTVDAYPGKKFRGLVVLISPKGVNTSNVVTFDVKIEIQPGDTPASGPASPRGPKEGRPSTRPHRSDTASSSSPAESRGAGRRGEEVEYGDKSLLKPEMTANVEIICVQREDILTVPSEAVIRKAGKSMVTLMTPEGSPDVPVGVGISDGTKTELTSGVTEGQTIRLYKADTDSKWKGQQRPATPGRMMGGGR